MSKVDGTFVQSTGQMFLTLAVCSLYPATQLTFSGRMMVLNSTGGARNFKLKTIHPFDLSRKLQLMATLSVGKGPFPWKEEDCISP